MIQGPPRSPAASSLPALGCRSSDGGTRESHGGGGEAGPARPAGWLAQVRPRLLLLLPRRGRELLAQPGLTGGNLAAAALEMLPRRPLVHSDRHLCTQASIINKAAQEGRKPNRGRWDGTDGRDGTTKLIRAA